VTKGQKILVLENDSLDNTIYRNSLDLKDAQIQLDSQIKQLDDYNILSPIDGVVVKKNYKEGDTINNASSNTILMAVEALERVGLGDRLHHKPVISMVSLVQGTTQQITESLQSMGTNMINVIIMGRGSTRSVSEKDLFSFADL
jgi:multidrug efflux pump subunit AcrA (membrane-fusion protein)